VISVRVAAFLVLAPLACATSGKSGSLDGGATMGPEAGALESGDAGASTAGGESDALADVGLSAAMDADAEAALDAPSEASPSGCVGGAAALVHDDFEIGSLAKWTVTDRDFNPFMAGQNVVTIDTARAHSGTHAVKVSASNGSGGLFGTTPPAQSFYGRAWVFMGADPGMGHWEGIVALGPGRNEGGSTPEQLRLGGQFDILYLNASQTDGYFLSNPNFFTDHVGPAPPVLKWVCEEFFFGMETVRWWITDPSTAPSNAPVIDVEPSSRWYQGQPPSPWSPTYTSIVLGYGTFGAAALDVWYDDVAIDTNRICCN
jgi:hypothetical protein